MQRVKIKLEIGRILFLLNLNLIDATFYRERSHAMDDVLFLRNAL